MGVTIYFEGKLRDKNSLTECLGLAKSYSDERQWTFRAIDSPEVSLSRVRDETPQVYVPWTSAYFPFASLLARIASFSAFTASSQYCLQCPLAFGRNVDGAALVLATAS